jgi:Kunitz/Bovine pancreatic trypsin inhibitor domain
VQALNARSRVLTQLGGALAALLVAACGAKVAHETAGGESHFLASCSSSCGDTLTCLSERCTDTCDDDADCRGLAVNARCVTDEQGARSCDVECTRNSDCDALGTRFACDVNLCREPVADPPVASASATPSTPSPITCQDGGQTYAVGATWQCSDGCNTCTCDSDGNVESTLIGCPQPAACEEGGSQHAVGDSWLCADGCNTCSCGTDGVAMTTRACPEAVCQEGGNVYFVGDTWRCADDCADCTCGEDAMVIREEETNCASPIVCTEGGQSHAAGETWQCSDGCNTCSCDSDGNVTTTDIACAVDGGAPRPECTLAPEVGDCDAAFQNFYFDVEQGECLPFTYGGCGGNANRYDTLEACVASCGGDAG